VQIFAGLGFDFWRTLGGDPLELAHVQHVVVTPRATQDGFKQNTGP
jgi:hypothetical protein